MTFYTKHKPIPSLSLESIESKYIYSFFLIAILMMFPICKFPENDIKVIYGIINHILLTVSKRIL